MDRFKFRGRGIDDGCGYAGMWFTGYLWVTPTLGKTYIKEWSEKHENWFTWEVDPKTVGQCTGLKDKNGKLIFEGDILTDNIHVILENGSFKTTYQTDQQSGMVLTQFRCSRVEIIGNIHESEAGNE